jgi:hypothetical protein
MQHKWLSFNNKFKKPVIIIIGFFFVVGTELTRPAMAGLVGSE